MIAKRKWWLNTEITVDVTFLQDINRAESYGKRMQKEFEREYETVGFPQYIAKDCLLTLVKSRLALGSPGCS